jgi:hypothetical protein
MAHLYRAHNIFEGLTGPRNTSLTLSGNDDLADGTGQIAGAQGTDIAHAPIRPVGVTTVPNQMISSQPVNVMNKRKADGDVTGFKRARTSTTLNGGISDVPPATAIPRFTVAQRHADLIRDHRQPGQTPEGYIKAFFDDMRGRIANNSSLALLEDAFIRLQSENRMFRLSAAAFGQQQQIVEQLREENAVLKHQAAKTEEHMLKAVNTGEKEATTVQRVNRFLLVACQQAQSDLIVARREFQAHLLQRPVSEEWVRSVRSRLTTRAIQMGVDFNTVQEALIRTLDEWITEADRLAARTASAAQPGSS